MNRETIGEWANEAKCKDEDPELFFPDNKRSPEGSIRIRAAKAVCRECVVWGECGQYALEKPEIFGIWGGMSELERRKILLRRKRLQK